MSKLPDGTYEVVFQNAFAVARSETDRYLREHPDDWFPCGFAWVRLGGRDPAVNWLKKNYGDRAGHRGHPTGWDIWNPSGSTTQCMEAKLAGAKAFALVLQTAGIDAYADSRMD